MNIVNTIMTKTKFSNANEVFDYFLDKLRIEGIDFDNTKALFNVGFTIENPMDNAIHNRERKFSLDYAKAEWQWYLSSDPKISKLGEIYGKIPPIWVKMADENGEVNSNYGYQWNRHTQLSRVIKILKAHNSTRQASISIYDGKEINNYINDTPCTYAINFTILNNKLNMSVMMRSNDIWYGFCNDQYCFSMLQKLVADELSINVGTYFHFVNNLHIYNDKL
jgi:thymidylate synthase